MLRWAMVVDGRGVSRWYNTLCWGGDGSGGGDDVGLARVGDGSWK